MSQAFPEAADGFQPQTTACCSSAGPRGSLKKTPVKLTHVMFSTQLLAETSVSHLSLLSLRATSVIQAPPRPAPVVRLNICPSAAVWCRTVEE